MTSAIEALRLGADDYLLKPCDTDELILRVERCFEKQDALRKIKLFSYSVSHDLKNPTIALHGLVQLLIKKYQDILPGKGKDYCKQIMEITDQISTLVEQINFYISTTEYPITLENLNLKEIFSSVREQYKNELVTQGVRLILPELFAEIRADKLCLTRVFRNLIDNALKHAGDKLSEIQIQFKETENYHKFSVANDGIGLEQEDFKKLFGYFKRRDKSNYTGGAGLGLAIVQEIIGLHGGEVWGKSNGQEGVTFYFTISKAV